MTAWSWVGVDLSTRKIAFARAGADPYLGEVTVKGRLADDRFDELMLGAYDMIQDLRWGSTFVIEDVPFVKSKRGALGLAQVLGGLRAVCLVLGASHVVVPGRDWKRGLGLSGNANKDAVREWVRATAATPGVDGWSQDLCDAFALSTYGRRHQSGA